MCRGVLLLQDNAPIHKSYIAMPGLHKCGFEELIHLTHSPHLASSDFYLFPKLKNTFGEENLWVTKKSRQHFELFSEQAVIILFTFGRSKKCIHLKGECIENDKIFYSFIYKMAYFIPRPFGPPLVRFTGYQSHVDPLHPRMRFVQLLLHWHYVLHTEALQAKF